MSLFELMCPFDRDNVLVPQGGGGLLCPACGRLFPAEPVPDLLALEQVNRQTAEHYTLQWGKDMGFGRCMGSRDASSHTAAAQLPWAELFSRIRSQARQGDTLVYDAACGWGGIFQELFASPPPPGLAYLGADIHGSLGHITPPPGLDPERYQFIRWDISQPPPVSRQFDYVICRSALHHTPQPEVTMASLADSLGPGGRLAVSVYARKSPMREAVDDALRAIIVPQPPKEAWDLCRQFALLGRDLQAVEEPLRIRQDLPALGIKAGEYTVQEFVYDHLMKCWYHPTFGLEHSTSVNFDWYHPEYAYRFLPSELARLAEEAGLEVREIKSSKYQHYLEAVKG